jgi:hypothetical protein
MDSVLVGAMCYRFENGDQVLNEINFVESKVTVVHGI